MCKYSSFQILLFPLLMGHVFVESCLTGTCLPQTNFLPVDDLIPKANPDLLPISDLPPCSGCEKSFLAPEFLSAVLNSRLADGKSGKKITPCEILKFAGDIGKCTGCGKWKKIGDCGKRNLRNVFVTDLSYVVIILSNKDGKFKKFSKKVENKRFTSDIGKTVVTGQGLRMGDGSILTIYYTVQL